MDMALFKHIQNNRFVLNEADLNKFVKLITVGIEERKKQAMQLARKQYHIVFFKKFLENYEKDWRSVKIPKTWPAGISISSYLIHRDEFFNSDEMKNIQADVISKLFYGWLDKKYPNWKKYADLEIKKFVDTLDLSDDGLDQYYGKSTIGLLKAPRTSSRTIPLKDPVWAHFKFNGMLPANTWLIHFAYGASMEMLDKPFDEDTPSAGNSIAMDGFNYLVKDPKALAFTTENAERALGIKLKRGKDGYGFAFTADHIKQINRSDKIGNLDFGAERGNTDVIMFQAPAVLCYHRTDENDQVVFSGTDAKNIVLIRVSEDKKKFNVYSYGKNTSSKLKGLIYTTKNLSIKEAIEWVENNYL